MTEENTERGETGGEFPVDRRTLMKVAGASGVSVAGLPVLAGHANAADGDGAGTLASGSVTVEQGDRTYTVEPLSYRDWSIERFYSYSDPDGASANTPTGLERSDVSRLFFYDGPGGRSLVIIHDRPNDGSGGSVNFQFDTLPAGGEWAVEDDPGETSYDRTSVDWGWVDCCTDGGAYRGLSGGGSFTLDPSFYSGIDEWQLLSGDPADPDVVTLDRGRPITISPGDTDPDSFEEISDQKLALAGSIDDISQNLSERPRVEATLSDLGSRIDDGDLAESAAIDAVERMILGENVTEATIAGLGPVGNGDGFEPDGFDRLVDTPDGIESLNIATKAIDSIIGTLTAILLSSRVLNRVKNLPFVGSVVDDALAWLDDAARSVVDTLLGPFDDLTADVLAQSDDLVVDTERELRRQTAEQVGGRLFDRIARIEEPIANELVGLLETTTPDNIRDGLADLDDDLGGDGSIDSTGSVADAAAEAQDGLDEAFDQLDSARQVISGLNLLNTIITVLGAIGAVLAASGVLAIGAAAVGLATTVVTTLFSLTNSLVGIGTLEETVDIHDETLDAVVNPR